jgi:hypothetical protein
LPLEKIDIMMKLSIIRKFITHDITNSITVGLIAIFLSLRVFHESLNGLISNSIPLGGDGLLIGIYIKLALQASWFNILFQNVSSTKLGWPGGIDFSSYPIGNTLEILLIKAYSQIFNVSDPAQIIHFFSIFKSFLIAMSMYFLARIIGIKKIISCFISLVFALSSYNLVRAEGHFLLGLTWSIPLMLTSIILAYKLGHKDVLIGKRIFLILVGTALVASISSFYYSFFLLLCNFGVLTYILLSSNISLKEVNSVFIRNFFDKIKYLLVVLFIQILGVLFQILPILIRARSTQSLTGVGDRSPLESLIYSGSIESLFFDLNKTGLDFFNRPDLINFIQTRISWEGSQIGLIPGIILILIIVALVYRLMLFVFQIDSSNKFTVVYRLSSTRLLILLLFFSLLFYFPSPVNFLTAQIFPQIRAWGRLSVFISIFTLLLLGIFLSSKIVKKEFLLVSLVVFSLSFGYELSVFAKSRPPSSVLSKVSMDNNKNFQIALDDLEMIYEPSCSLVNLPIYPFPEFDRSDDFNGDYSFLDLPIRDNGIFNWSYGGIKATENFRQWQSLISEFPPFNRAGIKYQINRGYISGACGAIIDKTYLVEQEKKDLVDLINDEIYPCVRNLFGPKLGEEFRYVSIQFSGENCKPKLLLISEDEIQDDLNSKKILWRFDSGTSVGFSGVRQVFDLNSVISFRFYSPSDISTYDLRIQLFGEKLKSVNLCLQSDDFIKRTCSVQKLDSRNIGFFNIPSSILKSGVNKFSMNLESTPEKEMLGWSVTPIPISK